MTIQSIRNQTVASLNLPEVLKRVPSLFINICADFDPQSMKNFLLTCKTIRQINSDFKKYNPITYSKFLSQIFPHGFFQKSIEKLSDEMIELCENTNKLCSNNRKFGRDGQGAVLSDEEITQYQKLQFLELKDLLNALNASGKFNKIDKRKLEEAFYSACIYIEPNMVELFIHSGRYQDISVDCLNKAFGLGAPRDDGSTIRTLINSNRFHEISLTSLGNALNDASINGHPGVVQAIIESGRAHEISLETFSNAFQWAARTANDKGSRLKTLLILMDFPQFNKISVEDLGEALEGAASNWRDDAVQAIVKSSRFHEISKEQLNQSFYCSMRNFTLSSSYALIMSGRFNEITVHCLNKSLPLAGSKDNGMVIKALVRTKQFQKISIESIGKALEKAAYNANPRALKAIIDSNRFAEIPLENFSRAVYHAAGLGFTNNKLIEKNDLESLRIFRDSGRFHEISSELQAFCNFKLDVPAHNI